jgi:hypothetical protein
MQVEEIVINLISQLQLAQVLRQDSLAKLSTAFGRLGLAQTAEAEAVEGQRLAQNEIQAAKAALDEATEKEAYITAQLTALQVMMHPPATEEPAAIPAEGVKIDG